MRNIAAMRWIVLFLFVFLCYGSYANPLDSVKVQTIKGKKYVIHKVDKGEGLLQLSRRYKVSADQIVAANEMKDKSLKKGETIRIPIIAEQDTVKAAPVAAPTETKKIDEAHANAQSVENQKVYIHVVSAGETISVITKKYKITQEQLAKWNSLKSTKLEIGQQLIVDAAAVVKPYQKWNGVNAAVPQPVFKGGVLAEADMIEETGFAAVNESMQVLHATAPVGTIMLVVNLDNNKQCLVKVTGKLDTAQYKNYVVILGNDARMRLEGDGPLLRVKVQYALKP